VEFTLRDTDQEIQLPNRRIVLSAVIMLLLVLVLGAQLVYLQW